MKSSALILILFFIATLVGCAEEDRELTRNEIVRATSDARATAFYDNRGTEIPGLRVTPTKSGLRPVHNDCGQCGTASLVGGWEARDGRAIVLLEDGTFTLWLEDGTGFSGTWRESGNSLCLTSSGLTECLAYEQAVDVMRLEEALYYRE